MKALNCIELAGQEKWSETLQYIEVDDPIPGDNEILISLKAASVNFPDVLMVQGLYQFQPPMPFIPGAEAAGVVEKVGSGVTEFDEGDHVFVMTGNGCFAEKLVADQSRVQKIPKEMDLQAGETLLVLGAAGGVGLAAVELGKSMGAKVIAAASTQEKVDICLEHGADEGFVYKSGNMNRDEQKEFSNKIKELTGGMGANVVYDPVGGSFSEPAIRATAWEGRYLVIGFAAGEIPKPPLNLALLKSCQIVGVFWGAWTAMFPKENQKNFEELFELLEAGKINPRIKDKFKLEDSAKAIAHLAERKATGKVIVEIA